MDRYRRFLRWCSAVAVCLAAAWGGAGVARGETGCKSSISLQVEPDCVPGGIDVTGTTGARICLEDPFTGQCNCSSGAVVSLSSSDPSLAAVPDDDVAGTFTIETNPPHRCSFPFPTGYICPIEITITATLGQLSAQRTLGITKPDQFLRPVQLDPATVLGGTISLARLELQCAAPPGGWDVQISSDSDIATPIVQDFTIPAGEDTATVDIATTPVTQTTDVELSFTSGGATRRVTLTVLPGSVDFTVRTIEVTQGIQYLDDPMFADNSLPLVRGKPTAVRVYPESNTSISIPHVPVSLMSRPCGTTNWTQHPPLWPSITVDPTDAADPEASYLAQRESPWAHGQDPLNATFLIDPEYLSAGCLDFRAEVNPDRLIVEEDYSNNLHQQNSFFFGSTRNLNIKFVRIVWCPGCPLDRTPRHKPPWNTIQPIIRYLEKVYPVDRVNVWKASKEVKVTSLTPHDFSKEAAWGYVLGALASLQALTSDAPRTVYYGLLDENVPRCRDNRCICGMAWMPPFPRVSLGSTANQCGAPTAAHEVGHNFGRLHAPCGDPDDPNPNWPTNELPDTIIGQTGFDIDTGLALRGSFDNTPGPFRDFMSYCDPEWVSPYTYMALYDQFRSTGASAAPSDGGELVDHLLVRGVIEDGEVAVATSYHQLFPAGSHDQEGTGTHSIVLRGANGEALFARRFTPDLAGADTNSAFFEILPYHPDTVQVDITVPGLKGDEVVESCEVTEHTPQVEVLEPNGGEAYGAHGALTVRWTASDPDGDSLQYAVLYSHDAGTTWDALAVDLTEMSFDAPLDELGGTGNALFRVVASDGVNNAHDDSDAVFSVARKPPDVLILNPPDRTRVPLNAAVALRGTATDPEDGALPQNALLWESHRDGIIALGAEPVLQLSPGVHRIALEGRDSDGNFASERISVVVGPVGDCDDDGDVDLDDFQAAQGCLSGPSGVAGDDTCTCADPDGDGDVDMFDHVFIQERFGATP